MYDYDDFLDMQDAQDDDIGLGELADMVYEKEKEDE